MGTFPCDHRQCIRDGGEDALQAIEHLKKLMSKSKWEENEIKLIKRSMDILEKFQPKAWNERRQEERITISIDIKRLRTS